MEEREESYERLAFLGDSVLNISISRLLFPRFDSSGAGKLTKLRAQTVSRRSCMEVARAMGVPERIMQAAPPGYEHQAERLVEADSVLAEAIEAVIGACFLEHGFEETATAVAEAFDAADRLGDRQPDRLQERAAGAARAARRAGCLPGRERGRAAARSPLRDGRRGGERGGRHRQRAQQEGVRAGGRPRGARAVARREET